MYSTELCVMYTTDMEVNMWNVKSMPNGVCKETDTHILMQYTGLKDKQGKEIYEGDILLIPDELTDRILDDGSGPTEPCNHLAVVTFQDGSFGVMIHDGADIYSDGFWTNSWLEYENGENLSAFEVIGNIYSNPELVL